MIKIKFDWNGYIIDYDNGNIICTDMDLKHMGSYTMGETEIIGSELIELEIRKEIKNELERTINSLTVI